MPKWKNNATEFSVNVNYNNEKGSSTRIPKPILEKIGNPEKIKFVIEKNGKIVLEPEVVELVEKYRTKEKPKK
ncbi:MAG: hypothetical protein ACYCQJ_12890 [Nitrososphaerales archaeon]